MATTGKIGFKQKLIGRQKRPFLNINAPKFGAPTLVKRILLDLKIQFNTNYLIVYDFNTSITSLDKNK